MNRVQANLGQTLFKCKTEKLTGQLFTFWHQHHVIENPQGKKIQGHAVVAITSKSLLYVNYLTSSMVGKLLNFLS